MIPPCTRLLILLLLAPAACLAADQPSAKMERIVVADDGSGFVFEQSRKAFIPWGFNYDHDEQGRLIEDYWLEEWDKVDRDFAAMRALGANVVRVHLQFGRIMKSAKEPNQPHLEQLKRLVALAEKERLYLDVTGLGCYHKQDVPAWYDEFDEEARWQAQTRFWEEVARACGGSPAIFCFDLMNEPVVPGGAKPQENWLGPGFGGKHFVQYITRDRGERERPEVARQWIARLKGAIRRHDRQALVTVGLVDWSLPRRGLTSGFEPEKIVDQLDFIAVHLYHASGKLDENLATLRGFAVGKPVVIEEMFTLKCTATELDAFLDAAAPIAPGGIGFYWGESAEENRAKKTIAGAMTAAWLDLFAERAKKLGEQK